MVIPSPSGNTSNTDPPIPIESPRNLRLLIAGDGGRELAGENTPTPASLSLEKSEASSEASSPSPSRRSSGMPECSGGVEMLSSEVEMVESVRLGVEDVSSIMMGGTAGLFPTGVSFVEALAESTTPSVRAITYAATSYVSRVFVSHTTRSKFYGSRHTSMPSRITGAMSRNANKRNMEVTLVTQDEVS